MKKTGMVLAVAALGFVAQACGDSNDSGTGGNGGSLGGSAGGAAGGAGGAGGSVACPGLTRDVAGTPHDYVVTAVTATDDACMLAVGKLLNTTLRVAYAVDTSVTPIVNDIKVGKIVGTPAEPSLGHGPVSGATCSGNLSKENTDTIDGSSCFWKDKAESVLTITGTDKFDLAVKLTESEITAGCAAVDGFYVPPSGTCTSTFTLSLAKAAAGGAGGAGGGAGGAGGAKGGAGGS